MSAPPRPSALPPLVARSLPLALLLAAALLAPAGAQAQLGPVVTPADQVTLGGWLQPAWQYLAHDADPDEQGFFLRRARLDVAGSVFGGGVRLRLLSDLSANPGLRDAWVELRGTPVEGLSTRLRMGQQIVPFDLQRERNMGLAHFGERAIAARRFELSGGRDVGVVGMVQALDGRFHLSGGAFNGRGANRKDPSRSPLLSGRASFSMGGPPASGETDLARSPDPVVTLSAGAMRHQESFLRPRPGFGADRAVDWHGWTTDLHARWQGVSLAAAWFEQVLDAEGNDERGDGFFLSGGILLPGHDVELALRHSRAIWDAARDEGHDDELGIGLTFFHRGHALQTRVQLARERLFTGTANERSTRILTIEHQLLLGG
jgi:hypothetical protein